MLWRRPPQIGVRSLAVAAAALTFMLVGFIAQISVQADWSKVFWLYLQNLAAPVFSSVWFYFALRRRNFISRWQQAWSLMLEPLLFILLLLVNRFLPVLWQTIPVTSAPSNTTLQLSFTTVYLLHLTYTYLLWAIGTAFLLAPFEKSRFAVFWRYLLLLGLFAPPLIDWLAVKGSGLWDNFLLSPFIFTLALALVVWRVRELWYFNLTPIARRMVIEEVRAGMLVVNIENRIVDLNRAAAEILGIDEKRALGQPAEQAVFAWPALAEILSNPHETGTKYKPAREVVLSDATGERTYDLRITNLYDNLRRPIGRLLVWHDITDQKAIEQRLRRQLSEVSVLHAVSKACVEAPDVNTLINRVTAIIGDSLYSDNFGVLLLENEWLHFHPSYHGLPASLKATTIPLGQGITGKVALTGNPLYIPDVDQTPEFLRLTAAPRSALCVPLKIDAKVIGVINAQSIAAHSFSAQDKRLLMTIADQLALGIERLRAAEAERREHMLAEVLHETGAAFGSALEIDQVFAHLIQWVARLVPYDAASIMLVEGNQVRKVHARGYELFGDELASEAGGYVFDLDQTPNLKAIVETRLPWHTGDIHAEPDWRSRPTQAFYHSWCGFPVLVDDKVVAIFALIKTEPHFFTSTHLHHLQIFAGQAGLALQNAQLFEEKRNRLREVTLLSQVISFTATAED
ncbi:MAG TPA: GAF domain-containing protein, partial [Anaerolineales bacterium]|nr:GAF domain-containing protein [Anaerolineales bacterium]